MTKATEDMYSQEAVEEQVDAIMGGVSSGDITRLGDAILRVGQVLTRTAFTSLALSMEQIVKLEGSEGPIYPDAAQSVRGQQQDLIRLMHTQLPALHTLFDSRIAGKVARSYAHDFLQTARGLSAYPVKGRMAQSAIFVSLADEYAQSARP